MIRRIEVLHFRCLRYLRCEVEPFHIMVGAKMVRHARYVVFQMAEVAVSRCLFEAIIRRIREFAFPPPVPAYG